MATKKKWTEKSDDKSDKKAGIKDGSKRDMALDKKRGLPKDVVMKNAKKKSK
jgi:hypothetical protein